MTLVKLESTNPIARLTINRPEQRNALSLDLLKDLHTAVDTLHALPEHERPTVVVVTGEGRAFCAGMDLKQVLGNAELSRELLHSLARFTLKLRTLPSVVVAVVNGAAIGGGCGIVTVCDLAISFAENKMGFPEVDLGVCPAVVGPWLVKKIGAGRTRQVLLSGGLMSGKDAFDIGILSHVAPTAAEMPAMAEQVIQRLATGGRAALAATKGLLNVLDGSLDEAILARAADLSADVLNNPETQEMLRRKMGA